MNAVLIVVDVLALLLLAGMRDLDTPVRAGVAALIVVNVLLASAKKRWTRRSVRIAGLCSLLGYAGAVVSWLILAFGCGIEYSSASCDAVVQPIIYACVVVSLAALPVGYLVSFLVKRTPALQ